MSVSIVITVTPVDRYGTWFAAHIGDRLIVTSRQPFLSTARLLLAEGVDPATMLIMRHAGSQTVSLKGTVGAAAKLTVKETSTVGPIFAKWKPFDLGEQKGPVALTRRVTGASNGLRATLDIGSEPERTSEAPSAS